MVKFLSDIRMVAYTSIGLAIALLVAYVSASNIDFTQNSVWQSAIRWIHVGAGIMWIGHLYYFNFTQIPNMPKIPDEQKPAVTKVIAPAALFWFRWGAVVTLLSGIVLAHLNGYLLSAYTLGASEGFAVPKHIFIGIGMWLATIMFINVWFVIWPNQQKALNIDNKFPDLAAADKAAAGKTAMLFSRTNTLLSLPMLLAMVAVQQIG
jgi:uncharacterized membrane protein